uniref:Endonuclease/exonuclease/phosphatase domain-containing protein n=1 Tax=Aegilops tauschii subsp. strangulata TaxID=200361 RepID=A0A453F1X2_AEGTS
FRRLTNDLMLKEVYLNGRRFTWSNEQSPPTLVHLDRVLCTSDWEDTHADCHLRCLASVVSDHSPLLLDCSPTHTARRRFHFEDYWMRLPGFHETVATAWGSVHDPDPFRRLMLRLQATTRMLTSWSAKTTGCIRDKMAISRELISRFDKAQEDRLLSPPEDGLRKQLKIAYLGLASLERTIVRQRARITTLNEGDAN